MPLVKLRSQVLRKHQKESKDSGAMEIALQSTSFFSLLAFFLFQVSTIKAGIVETNLSIQIFNLACLHRMFAPCIKKYWKGNQRKEQIISFFRCPCSIIQVDSNCATTSFALALLALAHRSKSFVGKDAPSHKGYVKKRLLQCSVGSWHRNASYLIRSGWFTNQRQLNLLRKATCKQVAWLIYSVPQIRLVSEAMSPA